MSVVSILNIQVLDNPTRFSNPFQFEITFECISPLKNDLEWKIVYVGSAEDDRYDQVLDQIMADAPDPRKIPPQDVLGVTVVLIVCSYLEQEFVRVGYYVNNEYDDESLKEAPPENIAYDRIVRNVLADKPRVTRIPIKWDTTDELGPPPPENTGSDNIVDDDDDYFGETVRHPRQVKDNDFGSGPSATVSDGFSAHSSSYHVKSMEVEIE